MHPLYHVLTVDTCLRKRCMTSSNVTDSYLLTPSRFFISCFRLYRILTWAAVRKIKLFAECFVSKTVVQRPNLNESYILACRLLYLNDKERDNWRKEWNFRILSSSRMKVPGAGFSPNYKTKQNKIPWKIRTAQSKRGISTNFTRSTRGFNKSNHSCSSSLHLPQCGQQAPGGMIPLQRAGLMAGHFTFLHLGSFPVQRKRHLTKKFDSIYENLQRNDIAQDCISWILII